MLGYLRVSLKKRLMPIKIFLKGGDYKGISSLCSDGKDEAEDHIEHVTKKRKTGKDAKFERIKLLDAPIKQTLEIVIVLAGMRRMRSGRSPIDFERGLVTGARKHLGYLAAKLAPDLGLNRVKNPTKTASPKKSTAERALKTIKKNVTGNDCKDDDPDYADHTSNVGDNDDEDGVGDDDVDAY